MGKGPTIEIQVCDAELIVYPSIKVLNNEKFAGFLVEKLESALGEPREQMVTSLAVDLSDIAWISSAGLNELIRIRGLSRSANVDIQVRSANDAVREVFRITRLERIFTLEDQENAAGVTSPLQTRSEDRGGTEAVASV